MSGNSKGWRIEVLTLVVAISAGIIAYQQYLQMTITEARTASSEILNRFNSDDMATARVTLHRYRELLAHKYKSTVTGKPATLEIFIAEQTRGHYAHHVYRKELNPVIDYPPELDGYTAEGRDRFFLDLDRSRRRVKNFYQDIMISAESGIIAERINCAFIKDRFYKRSTVDFLTMSGYQSSSAKTKPSMEMASMSPNSWTDWWHGTGHRLADLPGHARRHCSNACCATSDEHNPPGPEPPFCANTDGVEGGVWVRPCGSGPFTRGRLPFVKKQSPRIPSHPRVAFARRLECEGTLQAARLQRVHLGPTGELHASTDSAMLVGGGPLCGTGDGLRMGQKVADPAAIHTQREIVT